MESIPKEVIVALVSALGGGVTAVVVALARLVMSDDDIAERLQNNLREDLQEDRDFYKAEAEKWRQRVDTLSDRVEHLQSQLDEVCNFIDNHSDIDVSSEEILPDE